MQLPHFGAARSLTKHAWTIIANISRALTPVSSMCGWAGKSFGVFLDKS